MIAQREHLNSASRKEAILQPSHLKTAVLTHRRSKVHQKIPKVSYVFVVKLNGLCCKSVSVAAVLGQSLRYF